MPVANVRHRTLMFKWFFEYNARWQQFLSADS